MLYVVSRGHQDYNGGQDNVVHLVSSVQRAIGLGRPWTFTDRHAELAHALYFERLDELPEVPWSVMLERFWTDVKEERQAEFLVHTFFEWTGIASIGVMTDEVASRARQIVASAAHQPRVVVTPDWYY